MRQVFSHSSGTNAFTLLELVLVVGVLSVLLAILLPAPKMAREATFKKRAKAEATALAQAAIRYKAEYGFWPGEMVYRDAYSTETFRGPPSPPALPWGMIAVGPVEFTGNITTSDGALGYVQLNSNEVYQAFSTVGRPFGSGYGVNPLNPKAIPFLDLKNETDFEIVGYPDPWGNPYRLIMGLNPKSMFEFRHTVSTETGTFTHYIAVSNVTAFAFSLGPRGSLSTNYIYSAGVGYDY